MIIADPNKSFMNSLGAGLRMGQGVQQMNRQNQLYDVFEQHGQGIMQGDPNALAALAQVDPVQAFSLNNQAASNARSAQVDEARLAQIKQETAAAAAQEAARLTAAEREMEAQETARVASSARAAYEQGPDAFNALVMQNASALEEAGIDPNAVTYETWPQIEAGLIGAIEGLTAGVEAARGAQPEFKVVGNQLYQMTGTESGRPEAVGSGATPGMSITLPDGTVISDGMPPGQNPTTTNTPRDDDKLSTKLSENDAAALARYQQEAETATQLESLATQLETVAEQVGYTGPGGEWYGKADDLLGILPGDAGARGAFRSLAMDAQLAFTERTKGAITDREMGMFKAAVPNLNQTKEGNRAIAQVMRAGAKRTQTRQAFFEGWGRKYGSLEGAQQVWSEYMRDNPIIEGTDDGSIRARPEGDWQSYLGRQPSMSYTPENIMNMSLDELNSTPIEEFTNEQLQAANARYQQLQGGQ